MKFLQGKRIISEREYQAGKARVFKLLIAIMILVLASSGAQAQRTRRKLAKPAPPVAAETPENKELADKASASREGLIEATKQYRESLERLLVPLTDREKILQESLQKKKAMIEQGLIARRELEPVENDLKDIENKLGDTRQRIVQADQFIVEIANLELLSKQQAEKVNLAPGTFVDNLRYIRYTGLKSWSIKDYGKVEAYFAASTGHALPLSAFGQSETHNRLGFDHANSFDVALHPDTVEAQKLMAYLRSQGIPFTAFRGAIPGNATGAHIHIGYPSARIR